MSVKKILVAYDGSADSERALDWACDMARQVDATVHAIFVLELYDYFALEDTFYRPLEGAYREVADQKFAQIQEKYKNSGLSVTTHVTSKSFGARMKYLPILLYAGQGALAVSPGYFSVV